MKKKKRKKKRGQVLSYLYEQHRNWIDSSNLLVYSIIIFKNLLVYTFLRL
jgi:hypothetical protein